MPVFTSFNNRLPDPTFDVSSGGAQVTAGTGSKGAGFASVAVRSKKDTQVSRTISGRGVQREQGAHNWEIDINYHPMTRADFDVVASFLDARNARLYPFYVVLPQYSRPKNSLFRTSVATMAVKTYEAKPAGSSYIYIDINDSLTTFPVAGYPSIGDFFNIVDATDINHQKAYKITRVETTTDYNSSLPGVIPNSYRTRIHFTPPFVRDVAIDSTVRFLDPTFRVITRGDVIEYSLGTDNMYQFQLQLEEIQP
jgi:hypothetical protein